MHLRSAIYSMYKHAIILLNKDHPKSQPVGQLSWYQAPANHYSADGIKTRRLSCHFNRGQSDPALFGQTYIYPLNAKILTQFFNGLHREIEFHRILPKLLKAILYTEIYSFLI